MKMPLWAKGRDGKWYRFPYEAMETLSSGEIGFYTFAQYCDPLKREAILKFLEDTDWGVQHFFEYNLLINAYVLKDKPGEET